MKNKLPATFEDHLKNFEGKKVQVTCTDGEFCNGTVTSVDTRHQSIILNGNTFIRGSFIGLVSVVE